MTNRLKAIRSKKDASMVVAALKLWKEEETDALFSCDTEALLTAGCEVVGRN